MIDFVDASLGAIVNKLKSKGLYDNTLIIVASKHGNAPINPALFGEVNPARITNDTGVPVQWQTVIIPSTFSEVCFFFIYFWKTLLLSSRIHERSIPQVMFLR